jgi:ABC-type lipoprotein release transport system permease subunit
MTSFKNISKLKLTDRQRKNLLSKGKLRDPFEIWVDHHNHKLEVIRTTSSFIGMIVSCIIMLKVFGII